MSALWPHIRALRAEGNALLVEARKAQSDAAQSEAAGKPNSAVASLECSLMLHHLAAAKIRAADELDAEQQEAIDKLNGPRT